MVKNIFLSILFVAFFVSSPGYSLEVGNEKIIREIEETFAEDILSSSEVYKKRKFYRKYPHKFENGPAKLFLFHTDSELTLKIILGQNNFLKIPEENRLELIKALTNTFRRYAYEWLYSNLNTSLRLHKIELINKNTAILKVERKMKLVPDFTLKLFVKKTKKGWKVYDFGFWDFRYSKMKRPIYIGYSKNNDFEGLNLFLKKKNDDFFLKKFPLSIKP